MLDVADDLRRAGAVDAVPGHFSFKVLNRLVADRAGFWRLVRPFAAFTNVHYWPDDVRNHVAGALDHHAVTDADIFFRDVVEIM
jgi:hypothetical protein